MTEKLTLKKLSGEVDELRSRLVELEQQLERKIEAVLGVIAASTAAEPAGAPDLPTIINAEQRQQLIAETAYLIAERRGFADGDPMQDWIEAERQVNERLMEEAARRTPSKTEKAQKAARPAAAQKRTTGRKKPAPRASRAAK